jgi:hypothetical protein
MPEYCCPNNSSYPAPSQVPDQHSDIQSVEITPKYNPYPFTQPGPPFIQKPSGSLRHLKGLLTQISFILPPLAVILPIYFKSKTTQYARYFTYRTVLFTSSVQLYAN